MANWVRFVVTGLDDGSGRYDDAPDPASILVPVRVDPVSRRIVDVDNDLLEEELAAWRQAASDQWARTEGVFREVHQIGELGDFAKNEAPKIASEWANAAAELRAELSTPTERPTLATSPIAPEEIARRFAEADAQRAALTSAPAMLAMMRASTVPQLRTQAAYVRDRVMPGHDFDLGIECHFRSGLLTADELAELRGIAGTPGFA